MRVPSSHRVPIAIAFACAALAGCSSSGDDPDPEPVETLAEMRARCAFEAGARVADTLGLTAAERDALPINHVVVLMKENRSYDHVLGRLHEQGQPEAEAIPADYTNPGNEGETVAPSHALTTCLPYDLGHQWVEMHLGVNHGKMDGFVGMGVAATSTDGHLALSTYDASDLPFYYWLASTYALADHHFPSVLSGTYPNRNFLLLGTADGIFSTGDGYPDPATPTLFDALDAAGVTWGVYSDGALLSGSLGWTPAHAGVHPFGDFLAGLDAGALPEVVFVDAIDGVEDEHPTGDMQVGEAWTRTVYTHAVASPLWPGLAMFFTYDEGGGFFDHVPPPTDACIARPIALDAPFFELGVRVPFVAISPWARAHTVSHTVQDHTAITRFIAAVFDLPALTARDANMSAALELFDFTSEPALLAPPAAPAAGTGGCVNDLVLAASKPVYAPGEALGVTFTNGAGNDPKDRIAVYTHPASGPTPPGPNWIVWANIGGGQTPTSAPANGSVTLDGSTLGTGPWPLPAGNYIAYYLAGGGTAALASLELVVQ